MGKLGARQQRFVEEYMVDLNATQAAIRAGYSPKTAKDIACENLAKPDIADAIASKQAEQSKRTGITAERVLKELAKIGFADVSDIVNLDEAAIRRGNCKDDTAAIQSVKVKRIPTEDGDIVEREFRLYDKTKALEQLGRHLGLYNDKLRLDGAFQINFTGEADLKD